jgi:hypothetical protein
MTNQYSRTSPSWINRLLVGLLLLLAGAGLATWGLARWQAGARFLGVAPVEARPVVARPIMLAPSAVDSAGIAAMDTVTEARVTTLEGRLAAVESAAQRAAGSAGRADALLVAFAARRAIDRGVALGYLETLLVARFGANHQRAVAQIVTASRDPVRLDQLIANYERLGPALRGGAPEENWWTGLQRELGSIIAVRREGAPSLKPAATYDRARARLASGEVDAALAETMRLPGVARATPWVVEARRYVSAHRALDEIESAALLAGSAPPR